MNKFTFEKIIIGISNISVILFRFEKKTNSSKYNIHPTDQQLVCIN